MILEELIKAKRLINDLRMRAAILRKLGIFQYDAKLLEKAADMIEKHITKGRI